MAHILIIDDEANFARNLATFLQRSGHEAQVCGTVAAGWEAFDSQPPDAVVLDHRLPDATGLDLLRRIRERDAHCPLILITGHGSIDLAVDAMKAGAQDLLTKPLVMADLLARLEPLLRRQREQTRLQFLEQRARAQSPGLVGESRAMQALHDRLQRIAAAARSVEDGSSAPPILITGETGTGKELVARACHVLALGEEAPFVELNCAAIPEALLESELFGHERGAFTDARERKLGLFEAADGGTLFLDEIGELALPLQAKLLKVIEDGRLRRIGATRERQVRVRVIAATHQDLEASVALGRFRADLFFRLRVLTIAVPPLRERDDDVQRLAVHFLALFARRYRREGLHFGAGALAALQRHHWPGNVRELRNVIEQAVLLAPTSCIEQDDLLLPPPAAAPPAPAGPRAASAQAPAPTPTPPIVAAEPGSELDRLERDALLKALRDSGDNVSAAARALGVSRDTVRYRIEKHGLKSGGNGA